MEKQSLKSLKEKFESLGLKSYGTKALMIERITNYEKTLACEKALCNNSLEELGL